MFKPGFWFISFFLIYAFSAQASYHSIDSGTWKQALEAVKLELKKKNKRRSFKHKINEKHIQWLDSNSVKLQKVALKLKLMNHIMGKPKDNILDSYVNNLSLKRVKAFILQNKQAFVEIEEQYKVSAPGIAAVLYIETAFNASYIKYYPVLESLASLAALSNDEYRKVVIDQTLKLSQDYDPPKKWQKRIEWEKRAKKIGDQWINELAALLVLANQLSWDQSFVSSLKGSWAGAIGYSQFMPATAVKHVKTKDFDFWNWSKAIEFTAKKLAAHDWHKDSKAALMEYNRVGWYGKVVLSIEEKLVSWWQKQIKQAQ